MFMEMFPEAAILQRVFDYPESFLDHGSCLEFNYVV